MTESLKNHSLKIQVGTIAVVLLFVVTTAWQVRGMKADIDKEFLTMNNKYDHIMKFYYSLTEEQKRINTEDQRQDLVIMEISTKLKNIETMLMDIKKKLE